MSAAVAIPDRDAEAASSVRVRWDRLATNLEPRAAFGTSSAHCHMVHAIESDTRSSVINDTSSRESNILAAGAKDSLRQR